MSPTANESEWDESLPSRKINPFLRILNSLPTLPLHEWSTRALLVLVAKHAMQTGKTELLASAALGALTTHVFATRRLSLYQRAKPVKYAAQASVMLTPRLALHEVELLAIALYVAFLAARRHGGVQRTRVAEACFAGLLTHLFLAPSSVNGPRFLWWTWHEDYPSVRQRILTLPVSQALSQLCGGFSFSLLANWLLDLTPAYTQKTVVATLAQSAKQMLDWIPKDNRQVVENVAAVLDEVQIKLGEVHPAARVGAVALALPLLQSSLALVAQIASLDSAGQPSARSYKFLIALFALVASRSTITRTVPVKIVDSNAGAMLASAVASYFAAQAMISHTGDATKHVSTGVHQRYGTSHEPPQSDAFGNKYRDQVSSENGTYGFTVEGSTRAGLLQDLHNKREALDEMSRFLKASEKRVGDTELALQETLAWSKQTQKQVPHLGENEFVREMEATNSVRVARIQAHLEAKLKTVRAERQRIGQFEQKLRAKIAMLEDTLQLGGVDPAGNEVVSATTFGPQSIWYTIRGVAPVDKEEFVGVALLCALGITAFTKSLALGE